MNSSIVTKYFQYYTPTHKDVGGGGEKIMVGALVKTKAGELADEVRERFYSWWR